MGLPPSVGTVTDLPPTLTVLEASICETVGPVRETLLVVVVDDPDGVVVEVVDPEVVELVDPADFAVEPQAASVPQSTTEKQAATTRILHADLSVTASPEGYGPRSGRPGPRRRGAPG